MCQPEGGFRAPRPNLGFSPCVKAAESGPGVVGSGLGSSSLGRYVFGSEISYNKAPPRLPGLGC